MIKTCTYCHCDFEIKTSDIKRGRGRFCSRKCSGKGQSGKNNPSFKHGGTQAKTQTKEYRTWAGMKGRCFNPNTEHFSYYGGRGIGVCDRWMNSFENFFSDMGEAPTKKHSLDRIDPDKDYGPDNCRWATHTEQMNNLRHNRLITFKGETLTQEQWGRKTGLNGTIICKRLKRGWSIEKTLTTSHQRPHLLKATK